MHRVMSRLLAVLALGLAAMTVVHAQATIDDCEKIQAADAYNQCLAKFGPTSKVKSVEPEKATDFKANGEEAAASAGPIKGHGARHTGRHAGRHAGRHGGGSHTAHRGSGRKRMVIHVRRRRK